MVAERWKTWVCEECRAPWAFGLSQCGRCGNRTRVSLYAASAVSCESNPRFDGAPWESWEGNGPCQDCGARNVVWYADSDTWNAVIAPADRGLILCPSCFIIRAHTAVGAGIWKLVLDG